MNKEQFIKEVINLGIEIDEEKLNKLELYYKMIINYNEYTNLTRITNKEEVYLKHFYDSLTIVKNVSLNNQKLLDIGPGAGFPSVVLKIFFPNLNITMVDSLNKRIIFLKNVIKELNLENIDAIHARAEEYVLSNKEKFDIVTSRAVANLNMLSEISIPALKINGLFVPMKGDATEEIESSINCINLVGGKIEEINKFYLPFEKSIRTIITIKKITKSNNKYPRKFSEIKKKPL